MELYPPICNLLDYVTINGGDKIIVITTEIDKGKKLQTCNNFSEKIIIKRAPGIFPTSRIRLFSYLLFYLNCLRLLLKHQPKSVLYFDTISSWPALVYKRMKGTAVKLLVHYHEYVSPREYAENMFLVKTMHRQETKMYSHSYHWISQTNEVRLQKMITDNHLESTNQSLFHIMPNYPSKYWAKEKTSFNSSSKVRLVYIGSLGFDTMYLKELVEWVLHNKSSLSLDLYAYNIGKHAKMFLESINDDGVVLHNGCNYKELPAILKNYDVGLVIYKPVAENWIQNAPNKVFEYLACGLDVWFSKTITYTLSIARKNVYPKIIPVDFDNLKEFNIQKAIARDGINLKANDFFYENVYGEIYKSLSEA